ncbi:hypothetical protein TUM12370_24080 [Salmonella enterica subsp. enterica serovar Choleraesuis]|nr:hypothetical protein TUM12370_24080 [Salmonella enterica subsp. enterica serovar Choleraesuis]
MEQRSDSLDVQVLRQALAWSSEQPVWLCTVLRTWGSSPRAPGALLAANPQGEWSGSLSGGCVEESFLRQVQAGKWRAASQVVRYGDGGLEPDRSLPCGGALDILVEYLPSNEQTADYLQRLLTALTGHQALLKKLTLPHSCHSLTLTDSRFQVPVEYCAPEITILHAAAPCLVVAGYSSVAAFCVDFACSLGFEVIVCEPREEMLSQMPATLPSGARLVKQFPAAWLERNGCHPRTAIVALTHDARMDDLTLMEAVNTPAFYIGAMGSARNSANRRERLVRVAGLDESVIGRIHAPIGLDIGSKSPAEIALAVMSDIVMHKNGLGLPGPAFAPAQTVTSAAAK